MRQHEPPREVAMPKVLAGEPGTENMYADEVREQLAAMDGLGHVRVRRHSELILESSPRNDPVAHARFRRVAVHLWRIEIATHTGEWQPTGLRGPLEPMVRAGTDDRVRLEPHRHCIGTRRRGQSSPPASGSQANFGPRVLASY